MLNPGQIRLASSAVRELRIALSNFFLYAAGNTMVGQSINRFLETLGPLFEELESVSFGESEGRLVVEGNALDERVTGSTNMVKDLFLSHKVHTLTFLKGVDPSELRSLFSLLRPKALPTGLSLSQAVVQQSLEHVRVNEKVFVALSEGEVVAPAGALGAPQEGQNLEEALEALQYFLQIFSRVRPDQNKQELARRIMENMGGWLKPENLSSGGGPGASGPGTGAGAWRELMGGFLSLKGALASLKTPDQLKATQVNMDELIKRLVVLGESQGLSLQDLEGAGAPGEAKAGGETGPGTLLETDPVQNALDSGNWEVFFEPAMEEKLDEKMPLLQEPERVSSLEALWDALWEKIFSTDEPTQALCLRHLSRLRWSLLPRTLQSDGLRSLRELIVDIKRPANFPIALTLAQDWLPQELASPDWGHLLEITRLLVKLADSNQPRFDKQDLAARVALETVYCEPILASLVARYSPGTEGENMRKLFLELDRRVTPFLFRRSEIEATGSPSWLKTVSLLEALEKGGGHVYESWLEWGEKGASMGKFLDMFTVASPPAHLEDYFQRHWNSYDHASQAKILAIARQWKRHSFRNLLTRLLDKPEASIALEALETLPVLGTEGDGEAIVEAVKKYPAHGKDKEKFWLKACAALGNMADEPSIAALMEWAAKYKFMEKKKERGLEVRRAAIQALGRIKSKAVREFLEGLAESEKELKPDVDQALKPVESEPA